MEILDIYLEEELLKNIACFAFKIAKNAKYDGYQKDLAFMVSKVFDKKSSARANKSSATHTGTGINSNSENQQLAEII